MTTEPKSLEQALALHCQMCFPSRHRKIQATRRTWKDSSSVLNRTNLTPNKCNSRSVLVLVCGAHQTKFLADKMWQTEHTRGTRWFTIGSLCLTPNEWNVGEEVLDLPQVYSSDKYARHKLLGETEIRLGDVDLRRPIRVWMNLRDMDEVGCMLVWCFTCVLWHNFLARKTI